VHAASEKKYITSIDLILICLFVKEIKENRELFSRLKESDIDSFILDLKSTDIPYYTINQRHAPLNLNGKPVSENSLLSNLKNEGYAVHNSNHYFDCFSMHFAHVFTLKIKVSEVKRIIYQLLVSDTFTNEGIICTVNNSGVRVKKPSRQTDLVYWNIAMNQDIPIIPTSASAPLVSESSIISKDIANIETHALSKESVKKLRREFSMNWTNVTTPFDRELGVIGHFLKVVDTSVPFKPNEGRIVSNQMPVQQPAPPSNPF